MELPTKTPEQIIAEIGDVRAWVGGERAGLNEYVQGAEVDEDTPAEISVAEYRGILAAIDTLAELAQGMATAAQAISGSAMGRMLGL